MVYKALHKSVPIYLSSRFVPLFLKPYDSATLNFSQFFTSTMLLPGTKTSPTLFLLPEMLLCLFIPDSSSQGHGH